MANETEKKALRRDPESRRRAIVEAAAELVMEAGVVDLTHRRVAERAGVSLSSTTYYFRGLDELTREALEFLAAGIDEGLRETQQLLAAQLAGAASPDDRPTTPTGAMLAAYLADYLADADRVRAECVMYFAGATDPALRPLTLRWFDGFVAVLSDYFPAATARAMAVFADGAIIHALLHDQPLTATDLEPTIAAIIAAGAPQA